MCCSATRLYESRPLDIAPLSGLEVTGKTLLKTPSGSGVRWCSPIPPGDQRFGSFSCPSADVRCFKVIDDRVVRSEKVVPFKPPSNSVHWNEREGAEEIGQTIRQKKRELTCTVA
jgi:hypothetical protein